MDAHLAGLSRQQGGVFSAAQARAAGIAVEEIQWLVRTGRWCRMRRGVYAEVALVRTLADLPRERHLLDCAALRLSLQRPFTLSLWSAVRAHDLQTLGSLPGLVCGIDEAEARLGKGYRISGATLPAAHRVSLAGWPVTTGARTVVDAARHLGYTGAVVLADSALRTGATTKQELMDMALACSHYRGIGQAARACTFADGRAESPLESQSRVVLVARGLPLPTLQPQIYDARGFIGRTDMLWKALRVVGEVDGKVKYTDPHGPVGEVLWAEKCRMERLQAAGLEVVRWTGEELRECPERVVARFWAAVGRAGQREIAYRVVERDAVLSA